MRPRAGPRARGGEERTRRRCAPVSLTNGAQRLEGALWPTAYGWHGGCKGRMNHHRAASGLMVRSDGRDPPSETRQVAGIGRRHAGRAVGGDACRSGPSLSAHLRGTTASCPRAPLRILADASAIAAALDLTVRGRQPEARPGGYRRDDSAGRPPPIAATFGITIQMVSPPFQHASEAQSDATQRYAATGGVDIRDLVNRFGISSDASPTSAARFLARGPGVRVRACAPA